MILDMLLQLLGVLMCIVVVGLIIVAAVFVGCVVYGLIHTMIDVIKNKKEK